MYNEGYLVRQQYFFNFLVNPIYCYQLLVRILFTQLFEYTHHVRRCWLPNYSSVTFWFLFYFGDLFVYIILLGYITKRSSFKKMLRYSRNTLISLRNGWRSWRTTLTPIQASLHPPLSSQTWNELKSLNLLSSRRGQRGGNHLRCLSRQPFSDRLDIDG